jgi:imidazolonepropionase-like amidohydrolase
MQGPVDIVIEGNRIRQIRSAGAPGVPRQRTPPADADHVIDAQGMYVLPGFVDLHGHTGGAQQGTPAEYVYKLWLAHGVTTVREPGSGNGVDWTLRSRERSARNEITAPRVFVYVRPGSGWTAAPIDSPEQARAYVRWAKQKGVDGFKLGSHDPDIMEALLDEARRQGLGTQAHLAQTGVARMNVLDAARLGLGSMEHWYGLPEALFTDRTIQDYPYDYNYSDEYHRFAARRPAVEAGGAAVQRRSGTRDGRAARARLRARPDAHHLRGEPRRHARAAPTGTTATRCRRSGSSTSRAAPSHGSYWFDWTTRDEIEWKENFRIWMQFLNEYKNRGGRVCTGSDSGFIYKLYGFDYIRELELLQEAGFHPLEVIRSATLCGAETLMEPKGVKPEFGIIRVGNLADLVIVPENPLHNLKVLYGTGTIRLDDAAATWCGRRREVHHQGRHRLRRARLLQDVARMVEDAKRARRGHGRRARRLIRTR